MKNPNGRIRSLANYKTITTKAFVYYDNNDITLMVIGINLILQISLLRC
ncbi:hypothetical protein CAXC1_300025 [Candidatus Xenohaliotis californiensis]|uniref:Uncharacterized protein n=1 Tax=Candidatus Xenohaliotis californiensis TaxID=84677 RepID=A0ABM9N881_9RICK|nr:hypothetical protein CAXC1_300025 [Candidatus Xenohaliotis californiensis]